MVPDLVTLLDSVRFGTIRGGSKARLTNHIMMRNTIPLWDLELKAKWCQT